jgi:transposase
LSIVFWQYNLCVRKSFKYRLYPNRSQIEALDAMLESHRRLYNLALRERRDVYEAQGHSVSYGEQSRRFKETREVIPSFAGRTSLPLRLRSAVWTGRSGRSSAA